MVENFNYKVDDKSYTFLKAFELSRVVKKETLIQPIRKIVIKNVAKCTA